MVMTDNQQTGAEQQLVARVEAARAAGTPLLIQGGATKAFYGNPVPAGTVLDCSVHRGVLAYEPTELAVTARAGTPLGELEGLLAEHGQELPFEPPHFGARATLGGMVAAGLSGPRRPYAASVRDAVLGARILTGSGEVMSFGGRVMKNVAGYDLSRLMAGSLGVLGVLLEVSLKVMPTPPGRITLAQEQDQASALTLMQRWARQALPITATAWIDGRLYVRAAGSGEALAQTRKVLGGELLEAADAFWTEVREQRLEGFQGDMPLWRLSVRPATAAAALPDCFLLEWGGALRWLRSAQPADSVRAAAKAAGGHATLFRLGAAQCPADGVFAPLDPVGMRLHRRLQQAFDPAGILNPGRLYPALSAAHR